MIETTESHRIKYLNIYDCTRDVCEYPQKDFSNSLMMLLNRFKKIIEYHILMHIFVFVCTHVEKEGGMGWG